MLRVVDAVASVGVVVVVAGAGVVSVAGVAGAPGTGFSIMVLTVCVFCSIDLCNYCSLESVHHEMKNKIACPSQKRCFFLLFAQLCLSHTVAIRYPLVLCYECSITVQCCVFVQLVAKRVSISSFLQKNSTRVHKPPTLSLKISFQHTSGT